MATETRQQGVAGAPKPLRRMELAIFGLPDFAIYLAIIPMSIYIPFVYSRDLGLGLADVGFILMLARLTDVITDPLIGWLSDRTSGRFGRRKPWLAAGGAVLMVAAYQLFNPSGPVTNLYMLGWAVVLWLGWTMINIPYFAWGAELSDDYHERTRITGWRQAFGILGNISVLIVPVTAAEMTGYGGVPKEALVIVGVMALVLLPGLIGVTLWKIPERQDMAPSQMSLLKSAKQMFANGSFRLLFFGFMLLSLGTATTGSVFMLYAVFAIGVEAQAQPLLLGYFCTNVLALPCWVWLSHRIGKKETWLAGAILFLFVMPFYLILPEGQIWPFLAILIGTGVAGGNFMAISMSMKADVIDIAAQRTGEQNAGAYIAVWSLGQKAVQALAVGIALPLLAALGFDPKGENGPEQIQALRAVYAFLPLFFYVCAIAIIWRYPISAARLERLRGAFARRAQRRSASASQ